MIKGDNSHNYVSSVHHPLPEFYKIFGSAWSIGSNAFTKDSYHGNPDRYRNLRRGSYGNLSGYLIEQGS